MRKVTLASGAILTVNASTFAVSKALYQAMLRELKGIQVIGSVEKAQLYKDLFCTGFSSPEIESCLAECFKRCTYNANGVELKIDNDTFEPVERRDDYMAVCMEVAKENVLPFVNSLYAEFVKVMGMTETTPA